MNSHKNILRAFLLNISFSIFELIGGIFTNSVSIASDAIHDFGDAVSIGISYFLEKISHKKPNQKYTYGYLRYSILGALITNLILLIGSIFVIYEATMRLFNPVEINYDGMIIFAIFGVIINFLAAYSTKDGKSLNQKAVNLHMLEDVFGWLIVLVGSIIIKFTDFKMIDSVMSIMVAIFIFVNAFKNLKNILDLFLEKTPSDISIDEIKRHILKIEGVKDIHHIHIWSIDGVNNYATMHVVSNNKEIKNKIKEELKEHKINHSTIEFEDEKEECSDKACHIEKNNISHHHHY